MLKSDNIDMTIFVGDTRYTTSVVNANGQRNEGTKMDADIWSLVQKGEMVQRANVLVGDKKYFVCYVPIKGTDGKVIGAAWAGQPVDNVRKDINLIKFALIITVVISILIFAVVIYIISKKVVRAIDDVVDNIELLASGDLGTSHEMNATIKEIDNININFKKLSSKLTEVISNSKDVAAKTLTEASGLSTTAQRISGTADGVSDAVLEMAKGATEQADSVQKSSENIGMLSDAIQNVSDNAENLSDIAKKLEEELSFFKV